MEIDWSAEWDWVIIVGHDKRRRWGIRRDSDYARVVLCIITSTGSSVIRSDLNITRDVGSIMCVSWIWKVSSTRLMFNKWYTFWAHCNESSLLRTGSVNKTGNTIIARSALHELYSLQLRREDRILLVWLTELEIKQCVRRCYTIYCTFENDIWTKIELSRMLLRKWLFTITKNEKH